ncbi:MAG TPA: hypothetical protein VGG06_11490 [Thermoanaerobaculia bacterium]
MTHQLEQVPIFAVVDVGLGVLHRQNPQGPPLVRERYVHRRAGLPGQRDRPCLRLVEVSGQETLQGGVDGAPLVDDQGPVDMGEDVEGMVLGTVDGEEEAIGGVDDVTNLALQRLEEVGLVQEAPADLLTDLADQLIAAKEPGELKLPRRELREVTELLLESFVKAHGAAVVDIEDGERLVVGHGVKSDRGKALHLLAAAEALILLVEDRRILHRSISVVDHPLSQAVVARSVEAASTRLEELAGHPGLPDGAPRDRVDGVDHAQVGAEDLAGDRGEMVEDGGDVARFPPAAGQALEPALPGELGYWMWRRRLHRDGRAS